MPKLGPAELILILLIVWFLVGASQLDRWLGDTEPPQKLGPKFFISLVVLLALFTLAEVVLYWG